MSKNILLGIYRQKLGKKTRICGNAKQKKINLGTKMTYLSILGCKFEKVLSYLKSATSGLS